MPELTIEVATGTVRPITVPVTAADLVLISGRCKLCGWSLRESSGDVASAINGSVVAPGAGAAIATSGAQFAGNYTIAWTVELAGAAAAADANNFGLYVNGVLQVASVNAGAAGVYPQPAFQVNIPAGATYQVKAIGAGTAGVTYTATASATPVLGVDAIVELRDGNNLIATVALPAGLAASHSLGFEGTDIRSNITLHVVSGIVSGSVSARFARPGVDY